MEKKFRVLRFIGTVYKILAWIALVGGVLFAVGSLIAMIVGGGRAFIPHRYQEFVPGALAGVISFLGSLLMAVLYFVMLYGVGELIFLLLAIEENTRATAHMLHGQPSPSTEQTAPQAAAASPE
jgi:hypothetical protein